MSTAAAVAPAQPAPTPGGELPHGAAPHTPINPENVEADIAALTGGSAPAAPAPAPAPVPETAPAAPAPAAPQEPAPAAGSAASASPSAPAPALVDDDEPQRIRLNRDKLGGPDTKEWKVARMLQSGLTMDQIEKALANPDPLAGSAAQPAPAAPAPVVDPLEEAANRVSTLQTELAAAKAHLDYEAESRVTSELIAANVQLTQLRAAQEAAAAEAATRQATTAATVAEEVIGLYPELEDPASAFRQKSIELHQQFLAEKRPIVQDPEYLRFLADKTAQAMGVVPRSTAPAPAVPPAPAPAAAPASPPAPPLDPKQVVPAAGAPPRSPSPILPSVPSAGAAAPSPGDVVEQTLARIAQGDPLDEAYASLRGVQFRGS